MGKGSRSRVKDKEKFDKHWEDIQWEVLENEEGNNLKDYYFERHIK